jgi:hypothetical protein
MAKSKAEKEQEEIQRLTVYYTVFALDVPTGARQEGENKKAALDRQLFSPPNCQAGAAANGCIKHMLEAGAKNLSPPLLMQEILSLPLLSARLSTEHPVCFHPA